jgi:hypothetical protein
MTLTDTFVKQVKHTGKPTGDKYTDGGSMFLLVKAGGKYWRMDYSHADKRKTLALGIYPAVSLVKARQRRDKALELLAEGIDPNTAKQEAKQATAAAAANTFESVAREWMEKTAAERIESTQIKRKTWLEKDVFPFIGAMPIAKIGPRDVLGALRVMEGRGIGCRSHGQRRTRRDTRPQRRIDDSNPHPLFGHHRAQTGRCIDALNLRLQRPHLHRGSAQTAPTAVCALRRTSRSRMDRD